MNKNIKIYKGVLKLVREKLNRYEVEEIAHIENVLKGEEKKREHRRLRRTENVLSTTTEQLEEEEKSLETTERYELQRETENVLDEEEKLEVGVSITASYGTVQLESNLDYGRSTSSSTTTRKSSNYAQEVVEKASTKIQKKNKEERIRKTVEQIEEINTHKIGNTNGAHIAGIYQWVNKIYDASLISYGKRMMVEIMVPEPAANYLYAMTRQPITPHDSRTKKEIVPFTKTPSNITPENYQSEALIYEAAGLPPPPKKYTRLTETFTFNQNGDGVDYITESVGKALEIPEGYKAINGYVHSSWYWAGREGGMAINVGDIAWRVQPRATINYYHKTFRLSGEYVSAIPMTISCHHKHAVAVGMSIVCESTDRAIKKWRSQVHEIIMEAYQNQKLENENATAANSFQEEPIFQIQGRNPLQNREIEKTELKKACIQILQEQALGNYDNMFVDTHGFPIAGRSGLRQRGEHVKFFEQALDWNNVSYKFYPYYWAEHNRWITILKVDDPDPVYADFLKAGYARVIVPIRLGFEEAFLHYDSTGSMLGKGEAASISTPNLPIWEEMRGYPGDHAEDPPVVEKEWEVKVPTSLVLLKQTDGLPTTFP